MNSRVLAALLLLVVLILGAAFYYFFTQKAPAIKTEPQAIEQSAQTPPSAQAKTEQAGSKATSPRPSKKAQNTKPSAPQAEFILQDSPLNDELAALKASSRLDESLSSKRFKVYIKGTRDLSAEELRTLKNILKTLRNRAGYLNYALIVSLEEKMKLTLYNESVLAQSSNFRAQKLAPLWFKFNRYDMQSVKNSFLLRKDFKRALGRQIIEKAEFNGHTDDLGTPFYNYLLGLERSATIASEIMRQCKVMQLNSFGKDAPLTTRQDEKHRYKNRRVEASFS